MNKDYFLYVWHNATPSVVFFLLSSVFSHLLWLLPPDLCMTCVDWNDDANFKYQQRSRSNRQWSAYHTDGASGQVWGVESGGVKTLYAVCEMCKVVKKTTTTSKKKSRTWEWDGTGIIFLAWRQDRSIFVGIGKNISENSHPQKWNIHAHTYTVYTCTHPHFMAGSICLATIQQLFFSSC